MSSPSQESHAANGESTEPANAADQGADGQENRRSSDVSDETAVNERGEERPRADTVPPA